MVAIKSKSIDEISAMADQHLPVPGADVAWLVKRVRELEGALRALRLQAFQSDLNSPAHEWGWEALQMANAALDDFAKADQEDPV